VSVQVTSSTVGHKTVLLDGWDAHNMTVGTTVQAVLNSTDGLLDTKFEAMQ